VGSQKAVQGRRNRRRDACTERKGGAEGTQRLGHGIRRESKPDVAVSIDDLIALHIDDMTLNNCEPKNILDTERKAQKHLGTYFAKHDFTIPLKKANIKAYKKHRVGQGAKHSTINRELSWLHRCLMLGNNEELISVPIPKMEKSNEDRYIRTGIYDDESITRSCGGSRRTRSPSGVSPIVMGFVAARS
jgi:hypothetical protein